MSLVHKTLKIGTRGSALALVQARTVCAELMIACPDIETEIVVIRTSGDWSPQDGEVRLSEVDGGKGLFAKEIERALLNGEIDAAVHSMKDMDSQLPDGLVIDSILPREDVRDCLLLNNKLANNSQFKNVFDVLPQGAVVGTASVRRAAFMLSQRPDLKIVPFRGNVRTRIDKLRGEGARGDIDCTLLALAGLNRLSIPYEANVILEPEDILPSAGQGAVGIECRKDDARILSLFSRISDDETVLCVKAEREVLRVLDGSCHTPIGAYAFYGSGKMWLRGCVASLDGQQIFRAEVHESVTNISDALALGHALGQRLKTAIPANILDSES